MDWLLWIALVAFAVLVVARVAQYWLADEIEPPEQW